MTINKSILYKNTTKDSVLRPIKDELLNMVNAIENFVNNNENDLKKAIDETIEAEACHMDKQGCESDILTVECNLMHNPCAIPKISQHQDIDNCYMSVNLPIMYYKDLNASQTPAEVIEILKKHPEYRGFEAGYIFESYGFEKDSYDLLWQQIDEQCQYSDINIIYLDNEYITESNIQHHS